MRTPNWSGSRLRILDFDIENRPLAYLGGDFTTGEVTAIAWQFIGEPKTADAAALGTQCQHLLINGEPCLEYHDGLPMAYILSEFLIAYDDADMVTGHFIRGHDLKVINGALLEEGMPPLGDKLTHDTKLDLVGRRYISASQENLSAMLGIPAPKVHMNNNDWREANRLMPAGIKKTLTRCIADVRQHILLRKKLLDLGALGPPVMWTGRSLNATRYTP